MIAFLEGTVQFRSERAVVINVHGVGYHVFARPETLAKLPEIGGGVKIWTHHHVREDSHDLYGFLHRAELEFFELLIGISGIGPKGAMGVLGVAPVDTLKKAIAAGDTSYLTRISGIGRKTAEKIVLELKEKMAGRGVTIEAPELKEDADAMEALTSLGYSQAEARAALTAVPVDVVQAGDRVREALKRTGKRH